jgi:hypothetical protein
MAKQNCIGALKCLEMICISFLYLMKLCCRSSAQLINNIYIAASIGTEV